MLQKRLALILAILLFAPLNSGAAAWMSMSMNIDIAMSVAASDGATSSTGGREHSGSGDFSDPAAKGDHPHSHSMHGDAHDERNGHGHDRHDEQDCEEHCMSCSNHCSSLAIVSSQPGSFGQVKLLAAATAGLTSTHPELLFRPPIHA